jgi:serine/threonine-protein kinase
MLVEADPDGPGPDRPTLRWRSPAPLTRTAARRYLEHVEALRALPPECGVAPVEDAGIDREGHGWFAIREQTWTGPDRAPRTVAQRLAGGSLPPAVAAGIVDSAGRAVAALHRVGLVAGTVTPARLLLDSSGGAALAPPPPVELIDADPAYAAPEVLSGADPTPASDRYALAATAYALLCGAPPFGTDERAALRALTEPPPRLHAPVPESVVDLLARALSRDPHTRPAPDELARDLARALAATPASPVDRQRAETLAPAGPVPPTPAIPLGSRYLLDAEIGSGATGRVFRGRRLADDNPVAVKLLKPEYTRDTDAVVRFLRQRTVLPGVEHPHLVRVHDLIADGDLVAIVMDLVEGEDLRRLLNREPLTAPQALTVLAQLASALAAIHARGVVHRDVKPENVLVRWLSGVPYAQLTDFGLARALDGPLLTRMSQLAGTPAYVAPELVAGRPAQPPSDVYALGITGYELLAGRRPFDAPNTAALLNAHLGTPPARPAGLADPVWRLISQCLAKDPAARPSAAALADRLGELTSVHSGQTTAAPVVPAGVVRSALPAGERPPSGESQLTLGATRPAPPAPPAPAPPRRGWLRLVVAVAVCAVLGTGVGIWAGQLGAAPPATAQSSQPAVPPSTGLSPVPYELPVIASSPRPGVVRLTFPDGTGLPGFTLYAVYRDDRLVDQPDPGDRPHDITTADWKTRHCYRVVAVLYTLSPPPALKTTPACKAADGKPTE